MNEMSDIVETQTARIWMRPDGIAHASIIKGAEQKCGDIQENIAHVSELSRGKKVPLLMDIRESKGVDREGSRYAASEEVGKHITGMAVLVMSPFSRVMGNLWLRTTKPHFPTRLFTSEEDAIEWLKSSEE